MQYGTDDTSINCANYFEIDTRRSEWYTSSISPTLEYQVKLEYAGASGVDLNLDGTEIPDKMKVKFITLSDDFIIYHKLQGGRYDNLFGDAVYIGKDKDTCDYRAPYNYCVDRDKKIKL